MAHVSESIVETHNEMIVKGNASGIEMKMSFRKTILKEFKSSDIYKEAY